MGIEPTRPAWKAGILPLNYTRICFQAIILYHFAFSLSIGFEKVFYVFLSIFSDSYQSAKTIIYNKAGCQPDTLLCYKIII